MPSTKLSVRTTDLGVAQAIEAALAAAEPALDAVTLFEDGPGAWRVEAYTQSRADAEAAAGLATKLGPSIPPIELEDLPDLNWVAISQAALPPVTAGRFVVHGSHDRARIPFGPRSILIDAGEAFGTAHHATTLGCLLAIDRLARSGRVRRVLDLGCGSGVLAIAAARALPGAQVIATDSDPVAVKVAHANAEANGCHSIAFACADGLAHPWLRHAAPFDLIVANILAGPLRALAGDVAASVRRGGGVVLSGILNPEAPAVIAAYLAHGFFLVQRQRIGEWSTLTLRKRR
ncbi:MAG: 50S ribosomal protein L11 methyltransferase [Hyphomicrobium sp.]|uniref:50S ribosomal protein L11 methyltransferase n=1 Tax=Hyphomicrobium sp. TaxID=82 RepID=UPI00132C86AD|nr:50S ribosomal protein L11 methyltransferase [Hyphomicrobium sp.]KAB2941854.1 MAG: 50S ribosomal protein L11 methyltransferase [Hyphomicrobium sp.]MBZ0211695.1 50S ribosomal protein L11 methyltransferase [Hyphomicrobium sp.]